MHLNPSSTNNQKNKVKLDVIRLCFLINIDPSLTFVKLESGQTQVEKMHHWRQLWFRQKSCFFANIKYAESLRINWSNKEWWHTLILRLLQLLQQHHLLPKYGHFFTQQEVRSLSDAPNVSGSPFNDNEHIVKILSRLGLEYRELSTVIHARDSSLSLEELFHKLTKYEFFS